MADDAQESEERGEEIEREEELAKQCEQEANCMADDAQESERGEDRTRGTILMRRT